MGAGKGKPKRRRTQSITTYFNESRWKEWLEEKDLEDVGILDYYGFDEYRKQPVSPEKSIGFIITELFVDGVQAGAIPLPPGCKSEDFLFEIVRKGLDGYIVQLNIIYDDNGTVKKEGVVFHGDYVISVNTEMKYFGEVLKDLYTLVVRVVN